MGWSHLQLKYRALAPWRMQKIQSRQMWCLQELQTSTCWSASQILLNSYLQYCISCAAALPGANPHSFHGARVARNTQPCTTESIQCLYRINITKFPFKKLYSCHVNIKPVHPTAQKARHSSEAMCSYSS